MVAERDEEMTTYWEYRQNNSGGSFIKPAVNVYIEAETPEEADTIAQNNGIYFDPLFERDCDCCGNRWDEADICVTSIPEPSEFDLRFAEIDGIPVQLVIGK